MEEISGMRLAEVTGLPQANIFRWCNQGRFGPRFRYPGQGYRRALFRAVDVQAVLLYAYTHSQYAVDVHLQGHFSTTHEFDVSPKGIGKCRAIPLHFTYRDLTHASAEVMK